MAALNLDIFHRRRGASGANLKALEDGFLGAPSAGKRSLRIWRGLAIPPLGGRDVAVKENFVCQIDIGHILNIHSDSRADRPASHGIFNPLLRKSRKPVTFAVAVSLGGGDRTRSEAHNRIIWIRSGVELFHVKS